ncbi:50S ribosomal protein L10 [Desulfobaculum senezii]|uniref:50S ribosomal protein L10 n=1 Tax=Desulfobaculum sp. SPO524 TaxID=3378071 RepID=UPI003855074C
MNRAQKAELISQLKAKADEASIAIVTDFKGLKVENMTELRAKLTEAGVSYKVVKNTLARIALDGGVHENLKDNLKENCAIAFGTEDPVAAAKVLSEFAKSNEKFIIKSGSLDGKPLDAAAIAELSKLPSKPELLGKLLGTMNAVPTNFVCLFANLQRNFLYALSAIKDQKEDSAAA